MPERLTEQLASLYKRRFVRGQVALATGTTASPITRLFFSDAVPGRTLPVEASEEFGDPSEARMIEELSEWAARFSGALWLPKAAELRDRNSGPEAEELTWRVPARQQFSSGARV